MTRARSAERLACRISHGAEKDLLVELTRLEEQARGYFEGCTCRIVYSAGEWYAQTLYDTPPEQHYSYCLKRRISELRRAIRECAGPDNPFNDPAFIAGAIRPPGQST